MILREVKLLNLTRVELQSKLRAALPKNKHALWVIEKNSKFYLRIIITPQFGETVAHRPTEKELEEALGDHGRI